MCSLIWASAILDMEEQQNSSLLSVQPLNKHLYTALLFFKHTWFITCDVKGSDSCGYIAVMESNWKSYEMVGEKQFVRTTLNSLEFCFRDVTK